MYNTSWLLSNGQWNSKLVYTNAYEALLIEINNEIEEGTTVELPCGTSYTKRGLNVVTSTGVINDSVYVVNTTDETFRLPIHIDGTAQTEIPLYFYIGETVQNTNIINVGRMQEQIAMKTDVHQAALASMPSSHYIDLTLGNTGSVYTAPANGWFVLGKKATASNQFVSLFTSSNQLQTAAYSSASGQTIALYIPAKANTNINITYSLGGDTVRFRFIYAEGEK